MFLRCTVRTLRTAQIGVNGSVMRQLTNEEKKTLQDWGGFYDESINSNCASCCGYD